MAEPPQTSIRLGYVDVIATPSEIYLGIYIAGDRTYQTYLYGKNWRGKDNYFGLILILNGRIEILRKIRKFTSAKNDDYDGWNYYVKNGVYPGHSWEPMD